MYIVGVKPIQNEVCFAIVNEEGIPVFCVEEERFTRVKHSLSYTSFQGLIYAMEKFQINPRDVKYLVYSASPQVVDEECIKRNAYDQDFARSRIQTIKGFLDCNITVLNYLKKEFFFGIPQILYVKHHLAHAASAFYVSPFSRAAILSVDGSGENETIILAKGENDKIEELTSIPYPHSLGYLYCYVTEWLGFNGYGNEGKTMGLSAYGTPKYYSLFTKKEIWQDYCGLKPIIEIEKSGFFKVNGLGLSSLINLLGPKREIEEPLTQYHADIAATIQAITEEIMVGLARMLYEKTGAKNLCLCGGVALNSVANGKILKEGIFKDIYIQPMSNDAGTALGAAYYVYFNQLKKERKKNWFVMDHAYFGPEYEEKDILLALDKFRLPVSKKENIEAWTAKKISQGNVVGWYQGKAEVGPRALGNRSILADPRKPEIKDIVNKKVKFREPWRPFAPSVLREDCSIYFETDYISPFMILVYQIKDEVREKIPAVSHIDGTARAQTVTQETNPRYYQLIDEFKKITGIGILLNTSFNIKGEPLVLTPKEAIEDFLYTEMDVLVLGDYKVEKKDLSYKTNSRPYNPFSQKLKKLSGKADEKYLCVLVSNRNLDQFFTSFSHIQKDGVFVSPQINEPYFDKLEANGEKFFYEGYFSKEDVHIPDKLLRHTFKKGFIYVSGSGSIFRLAEYENIISFVRELISDENIFIIESSGNIYGYKEALRILQEPF